jgi:hypothetical protein
MFVHDAGVVDGHFPSAELDDLAAQFLVGAKEWRSFQHWNFELRTLNLQPEPGI